jgi:hypothetical protein
MPLKTADEYRQRAQRARALAAMATTPRTKAALLQVAKDCDELACFAEKGKREAKEIAKPD